MRILAGFDGSPSARAALAAALRFPWPRGSRVRCVVALGGVPAFSPGLRRHAREGLRGAAEEAGRRLRDRGAAATVGVRTEAPVEALRREAERFKPDIVVLGWRGHGTFRRLLLGSVSRRIAEEAKCSVLVARHPPPFSATPQTFLAGFDGSANSRRALRFLARLEPHAECGVHVVSAVEPLYTPPLSRLTAQARRDVLAGIRKAESDRARKAQVRLRQAGRYLEKRGWRLTTQIARAAPLFALLDAASSVGAQALVVGARGAGGLSHVLLGSVASGALDRSPIPVIVAR